MHTSKWVAILALTVPATALAQESRSYQCTFGDNIRRVEIFSEPGVSVPCEVHYYKDTEVPGERQVLWSAQNDASYCEAKTQEFVAKLTGWGWSCQAGDPAMPEEAMSEEMPAEDMSGDMPAESVGDEMLGDEPETPPE